MAKISARASRNGLVDYGRFVAALGIVWFHTQAPGSRIAYIALPFFLVLLAFPSSASVVTKARRLLGPFVVFSALFAVINVALAIRRGQEPLGWWEWHMLLSGTSIHLWFLPFAFIMTLMSPVFRQPRLAIVAPVLAALFLAFVGTPTQIPLAQWAFGVVPVLVGFTYFAAGPRAAVSVLLASWAVLFSFRPSIDNITILVGTAGALATLAFHAQRTSLSDLCADLSLWVYLCHPLVILAGHTLHITGIALAIFSVLGSVALALAIRWAKRQPWEHLRTALRSVPRRRS